MATHWSLTTLLILFACGIVVSFSRRQRASPSLWRHSRRVAETPRSPTRPDGPSSPRLQTRGSHFFRPWKAKPGEVSREAAGDVDKGEARTLNLPTTLHFLPCGVFGSPPSSLPPRVNLTFAPLRSVLKPLSHLINELTEHINSTDATADGEVQSEPWQGQHEEQSTPVEVKRSIHGTLLDFFGKAVGDHPHPFALEFFGKVGADRSPSLFINADANDGESAGTSQNDSDATVDGAGASVKPVKPVKPKKLKPFARGRPELDVDSDIEELLAEQGVWRTQNYDADVAICQGIMDVKASPEVVWGQLFDWSTYVGKVPVFSLADVYKREIQTAASEEQEIEESESVEDKGILGTLLDFFGKAGGDHPHPAVLDFFGKVVGADRSPSVVDNDDKNDITGETSEIDIERIFVKYQSQVIPGIRLTCYCDHTHEPSKKSVTWECDDVYSKQNSVDEVQGHWHVEPHPDGSNNSRVFYQIALLIPRWLPRWIVDSLSKNVVKEATLWVKAASEHEAVSARLVLPDDADPPPPIESEAPVAKPEGSLKKADDRKPRLPINSTAEPGNPARTPEVDEQESEEPSAAPEANSTTNSDD